MNPSDPIGRPRKTGALFSRLSPIVFHKKDSISLLRALFEFSSLKKTLVVYDRDDEYEFVRPRLECLPSRQQVMRKTVQLKKWYRSKLIEAAAGGLTGNDAVIFELSEKLWGEEIMLQLKEKESGRSAREVRLGELRDVLGLEDVRLLKDGSDEGGGDVRTKSGGQSSGMVSGKGGERKRENEPGKIGGMAENVSGDEVLDDGDGEIVGLDKSSAKSGSEDGESTRKVSLKKEKKHKGVENGKLEKAEDSRAKSGLVDRSSSASYGSRKEKKHKRRELDNFSQKGSGIEDDGSAKSPADSQLDKGEKSRKKKKDKGDEAGKLKRLSEGKLARNFLEKENNHRGDKKSQEPGNLSEKGSASLQLEDGKLSKKKKKKHKGDRS